MWRSYGSNGMWIMPFCPDGQIPGAGTHAARGVSEVGFRRHRGKKGTSRTLGTHRRRCTSWHDDENHASSCLRNAPTPTLAFTLHNHEIGIASIRVDEQR